MTTREITRRVQVALAYLEDGARETGLIRLADIVRANEQEIEEIERLGASAHRSVTT